MNWKDKALAATSGSQFGAILHCAFGVEKEAPCFNGKASVTSDGFVMCNFTDKNGEGHWGAFVGSVSDLKRNVEGLAKHLKLNAADRSALTLAVAGWVAQDWRS
jgi:hypothetical protein